MLSRKISIPLTYATTPCAYLNWASIAAIPITPRNTLRKYCAPSVFSVVEPQITDVHSLSLNAAKYHPLSNTPLYFHSSFFVTGTYREKLIYSFFASVRVYFNTRMSSGILIMSRDFLSQLSRPASVIVSKYMLFVVLGKQASHL